MYVVLIMAGFWVTECLPLPVTALIPMVLFPLMGVLDSDRLAKIYISPLVRSNFIVKYISFVYTHTNQPISFNN